MPGLKLLHRLREIEIVIMHKVIVYETIINENCCGLWYVDGQFLFCIHFKPSIRLVHWMLVLAAPILCHALCNTIVLLYDRVDVNSLLFGYHLMFGLIGMYAGYSLLCASAHRQTT